MTLAEYNRFEEEIQRELKRFIEDHPKLKSLSEVARRNMATCGASGAMAALTSKDLQA